MAIACGAAPLLKEPDPAYRAFLRCTEQAPDSADIHIRLVLDPPPDIASMKEEFSTDESWSLLSDGRRKFVVLAPPSLDGAPLWVARLDDGPTKVTVYCGPHAVRTEGGQPCVANPVRYPFDQILLMYFLAERHGALIHAAGVGIGDRGFIFPGRSGAGKSTLTRQLAQRGDLKLLSDDRVIVRQCEGGFRVFGTPWPGEAGVAVNESVPLDGIVFIRHAAENSIKEVPSRTALENLLPVTSVPWYNRDAMSPILSFCEEMISNIPTHELHFKPTAEVVDALSDLPSAKRRPPPVQKEK